MDMKRGRKIAPMRPFKGFHNFLQAPFQNITHMNWMINLQQTLKTRMSIIHFLIPPVYNTYFFKISSTYVFLWFWRFFYLMNYIMINWKTESELIFFSSPQNAKYKWDRGFLRRDHISLFSIPEEHFFQAISPIHNMNSMRRRTVSKKRKNK